MRKPLSESHPATGGRRLDIQGLRAVAVILVVADHFVGEPASGFVGVDIFFVISGFLISGLLLREHERSGRIDLIRFYKRRIKRTIPVAWTALVVVALIGSLVSTAYGWQQLWTAAVRAATFSINWQLIEVGTDYLHATEPPTALQHFWSLAVEEQFYLVWPVVLLSAIGLARWQRWRRTPSLTLALGGGLLLSLGWAARETVHAPTSAYFSTYTRGWELLLGAAVALLGTRIGCLGRGVAAISVWSGLALLVAALMLVGPDSSFPFPAALLPTVGTALIILGGVSERRPIWILRNSFAQWSGKLSYSIYLWHWPIIVFGRTLNPQQSPFVIMLEAAVTLSMSTLSFHLIEQPLRTTSWRRPRFDKPAKRIVALCLVASFVTCGGTAGILLARSESRIPAVSTADFADESPASAALRDRERLVLAATTASRWPSLHPSDTQLGENALAPEWIRDGCLASPFEAPHSTVAALANRCVYGDPDSDRTAIVYGDSLAISYLPAIQKALSGSAWRIEVLTTAQCPAIDVSVRLLDLSPYPQCDSAHRYALHRIAKEHPTLVISSSAYLTPQRLTARIRPTSAWAKATTETLLALSKSASHVLLIDPPPTELSPQACKTPITRPSDCVTSIDPEWISTATTQRSAFIAARLANVSYPNTLPWFCTSAGRCPSFVGNVVTLADSTHLTAAGSEQLAPLLREAVTGALQVGSRGD